MKLRKILNADISGKNPENKITGEKTPAVKKGIETMLEHDIFFSDSVKIYTTETRTEESRLILDTDYTFAIADSIATEMSNKDCYRALVFTKDHPHLYVDYQVYGDAICGEIFDDIRQAFDEISKTGNSTHEVLSRLSNTLTQHLDNPAPHQASTETTPERLVLRTKTGAIKTPANPEQDEAVNKEIFDTGLLAVKNEAIQKVQALETELTDKNTKLHDKIRLKTEALESKDFLPQDMGSHEAPTSVVQKAEENRIARANEITRFFNVVRNENGSITIPPPQKENEPATKKLYDEQQKHLETLQTNIRRAMAKRGYEEYINWATDIPTRMINEVSDIGTSEDVYKKYYAIRNGALKKGARKTIGIPPLPTNAQVIFFNGTAIKKGNNQTSKPIFCIPEFIIYSEKNQVYYDITKDLHTIYDLIFIEVAYTK